MIRLSSKVLEGDHASVLRLCHELRCYPMHTDLRNPVVHRAVDYIYKKRPKHSMLFFETWFSTVGPRFYDVLR